MGAPVMLRIACSDWDTHGERARPVRRSVFVVEQGIPESEEWDEFDAVSVHALAWLHEQVVGTARLLPDGKIGRMAVLAPYRTQGIGSALLAALVQTAHARGLNTVRLSAQTHALAFYAKHGFRADGPPHEEVGIPHQWMTLDLQQ